MITDKLHPYEGKASPQNVHVYQQKVGSITYPSVITRPDVTCAANKLAEFLLNPSPKHHKTVDQVISYLDSTKTLALELGTTEEEEKAFIAANDTAYGDNADTRYSTEGYIFYLFNGPIDWKSTKQKTVTTSTTEAELLSLSHAAKELYWWRRFFQNLELQFNDEYSIQCNNQQTVRLMNDRNVRLVTKLKHVDIHNHWLRQEVERQQLKIDWIPTNQMPANGFTKVLLPQKHAEFIKQLNLVDVAKLIELQK